ncbi:hypothetical protein [Aeromonas salmonicida]|uniref:hypothetical protein n=1 Tax=Aeromonas salmonicida TaxID=645 RepID=UPI001BA7D406|nr:hypothetical protein [Aeromonas salmonicida]MBS2783050.1 hypothetical protein [Aeromonas salmonicida]
MFEVTKTGELISTGQLVRLGESNVYASVNPGEGCSGLIIPDTILGGTVATKIRGVQ